MTRTYLVRGLVVGVVAGLLAFVVAKVLGEPWVDKAIALEKAHAHAAGAAEDAPLVTRGLQANGGLLVALLLFGTTLGGIFGLVSALTQGRLGRISVRANALTVAALGFLGVFLIPFVKYPGNPPAVGNPDTIEDRTATYFTFLAASVVLVVGATVLATQLRGRFDAWNAALIGAAVILAGAALLWVVYPGSNEVGPGFPADVLFRFRVANVAIQATLYAAIGLGFGWLTERSLTSRSAAREVASTP